MNATATSDLVYSGAEILLSAQSSEDGLNMEQSKTAVLIRRATLADAPSLASVLRDSFLEYKLLYTPEAFAATTPTSEQMKVRLNEGPVWAAVYNGDIVGTVAVAPRSEGLYIRRMGVLPTARGHRIGELLLKEIERYALQQGHSRLFLSTTPFLHRAIRLYEQFGFRRTNVGPHDLFGTPLFTMEKRLETLPSRRAEA